MSKSEQQVTAPQWETLRHLGEKDPARLAKRLLDPAMPFQIVKSAGGKSVRDVVFQLLEQCTCPPQAAQALYEQMVGKFEDLEPSRESAAARARREMNRGSELIAPLAIAYYFIDGASKMLKADGEPVLPPREVPEFLKTVFAITKQGSFMPLEYKGVSADAINQYPSSGKENEVVYYQTVPSFYSILEDIRLASQLRFIANTNKQPAVAKKDSLHNLLYHYGESSSAHASLLIQPMIHETRRRIGEQEVHQKHRRRPPAGAAVAVDTGTGAMSLKQVIAAFPHMPPQKMPRA